MKRFGRIMLTVMGLAVAAAMLSSIPALASGPSRSITANGVGTSVTITDNLSIPDDSVMVNVQISRISNTQTYLLSYFITDTAGMVGGFDFGSIPASSVNVSGGNVKSGNTVLTLNVNTCDFPEFIANGGPCGTFDMTWTERPPSETGWTSSRDNIVIVFPNGEKQTTTGDVVGFSALVTGTALNYSNTGGPAFGALLNQKNVTKTFTAP